MRITVIDTETGGLDPLLHASLEIAFVSGIAQGGTFTEESAAHLYIFPHEDANFNLGALKVNHTFDRVPLQSPERLQEDQAAVYTAAYLKWAHENDYQVWAQRDEFDHGFIKQMLERHKCRDRKIIPTLSSFQCLKRTFRLAKSLGYHSIEKDRLKDICEAFKIRNPDAHSALSDARTTAHCIARVLLMFGH